MSFYFQLQPQTVTVKKKNMTKFQQQPLRCIYPTQFFKSWTTLSI